jgi:hypothetical protein
LSFPSRIFDGDRRSSLNVVKMISALSDIVTLRWI